MTAPDLRFYVAGLEDARRAFRDHGGGLTKDLQRANKGIAEEVAGESRSRYSEFYAPASGRHQKAIKATATQTKAQVRLDDKGASAGLLAQEFHDGDTWPQFRGGEGGVFFYPAVGDAVPKMRDRYLDVIGDLIAKMEGGPGDG